MTTPRVEARYVFAKPAWAMLLGSPQPQTRRTSRAVAITAPFGASPLPHALERAEWWVLWWLGTQGTSRVSVQIC